MQCINCGFENIPGLKMCARCQSTLDLAAVSVQPPRRGELGLLGRSRRWFAPVAVRVGNLRARLAEWWGNLRSELAGRPFFVRGRLLAWSIIPGLGQIKAGQKTLGRSLLIAWLAAVASAICLAGSEAEPWIYALVLSIHGTAFGLILGPTMPYAGLARRIVVGLLIVLALHFLLYRPIMQLADGLFVPVQVGAGVAEGPVREGDVIVFRGRFWGQRDYRRGDLVLYDMHGVILYGAGEHAGPPGPVGRGFDRIIGLPGDTLAIKGGVVLLNGQPSAVQPLGRSDQWQTVTAVQAGPNEYLIVPSQARVTIDDYVGFQALADQTIRVRSADVVGRASWRIRPLNRMGRVE